VAAALRRLIAARDAHLHFKSHARTKICTRAHLSASVDPNVYSIVQKRTLRRSRNVKTRETNGQSARDKLRFKIIDLHSIVIIYTLFKIVLLRESISHFAKLIKYRNT